MKIKRYSYSVVLVALLCVGMWGCKKKDSADESTVAVTDAANAANFFMDAKNMVDEVGFRNGAYTGILSDTAVHVKFDTLNHADADTISINFGTSNITCPDGRQRKGKITATFSGAYTDTARTHTIKFYNYYIDNQFLSGILKDAYRGYNAMGHRYFSDTVNGNLMYSNHTSVTWYSANKVSYTAGDSTSIQDDDEMMMEGQAHGTTSDGDAMSVNIGGPLIKHFLMSCRKYFVKGKLQIVITNKSGRVVDLGDGACDDMVTVTIDGTSYSAHLN